MVVEMKMSRMRHLKTTILPVVMTVLGMISKRINKYMNKILGSPKICKHSYS